MASSAKRLSPLASLVDAELVGIGDPEIVDVHHDSRQVTPSSLYVALVGSTFDGHDFVDAAVDGGAAAVCVQRAAQTHVPQMLVADTRAALGDLAAEVHDHPSHSLDVVGVTGTNGKTTVTHYVESLADRTGRVTGLLGTIHTRIAGVSLPADMTTPEASDFQRLLADMRAGAVSVVAAEVSSHALELGRVRGTRFAVAAFTNLSQDHLDFHGDMSRYRQAKQRLFTDYEIGTAVVNVDDPVGLGIAADFEGRLLTVGRDGDVSIRAIEGLPGGHTRVRLETPWGDADRPAPVLGEFNLSNLAVAVACCVAAGIEFRSVADALPHLSGVPGRFEVVSGDDPVTIIVDYAHTPEAVARAVQTARGLAGGRVIGLIGAGGDRDRAKRPAMGAAISLADSAIVTSDNPRSEDPEAIAASVLSGVDPGSSYVLEIDRRRAIQRAVEMAEDGDVVLILGRGHEQMQDIEGRKLPFDDRQVARAVLEERRKSAGHDGRSGSMTT